MYLNFRNTLSILFIFLSAFSFAQQNRTIDGTGNNIAKTEWGSAQGPVIHHLPPAFEDRISTPARSTNMNPRVISNTLFHQTEMAQDIRGLNDFAWAFGQFVDHDIVLVENFGQEFWQTESVPVIVPADDTLMEAGKIIPVMRSLQREGTGTDINNPRGYQNEITAFVDASAVYGSNEERAEWLRTFEGGKMKVSKGNLLPWNTVSGEFNDRLDASAPHMADDVGQSTRLFVAGDIRANENPMLLSLHLLFVREHNRLCESFLLEDPNLDPNDPLTDEELYQRARKVVGGILQKIVFDEWIPTLGVQLDEYQGYDEDANPSITNAFSAASFRWGHTMINDMILRYDAEGNVAQNGHISLKDAFFNPLESLRQKPDYYFKGMGVQVQQNLDCQMVGSVRNFLFEGNPVLGGLDLAAINIQRGRERGIMDYNAIRAHLGLQPRMSFDEICIDGDITQILEDIYQELENIDPWVGMLAEDPIEGSIFGEILNLEIKTQFENLRDGDRYFFLNDPNLISQDLDLIENTTMAELIIRNTELDCFQENAFVATPHDEIPCFPEVLPSDLRIAAAPNPILTETFLTFYSKDADKATIRVVNEAGQEMMNYNVQLVEGENRMKVDFTSIVTPGAYYLLVERGYDLAAVKVLKL